MPIPPIREPSGFGDSFRAEGHRLLDMEKLEKACMEFESLFIYQLMKTMRQTVPLAGYLGEGRERTIFQSFFDEEVSKKIGRNGGLGLGKMLYQKIQKRMEEEGLSTPTVQGPIGAALSKEEAARLSKGEDRADIEPTPQRGGGMPK